MAKQKTEIMRIILKRLMPRPIWDFLKRVKYRIFGHPKMSGETSKAKQRRIREGFFEKYCTGKGLDVGYGGDILTQDCRGWDFDDGDAQYLKGIADSQFDFVYSSHVLEHMVNPEVAIRNWWRVIKVGGYLILYIPHRDLYEKRKILPSKWNNDHKHFFLLDRDEKPDTIGIIPLAQRSLDNFKIIYGKICCEGHTITDPERHSDGEYSIEVVMQKINAPNSLRR